MTIINPSPSPVRRARARRADRRAAQTRRRRPRGVPGLPPTRVAVSLRVRSARPRAPRLVALLLGSSARRARAPFSDRAHDGRRMRSTSRCCLRIDAGVADDDDDASGGRPLTTRASTRFWTSTMGWTTCSPPPRPRRRVRGVRGDARRYRIADSLVDDPSTPFSRKTHLSLFSQPATTRPGTARRVARVRRVPREAGRHGVLAGEPNAPPGWGDDAEPGAPQLSTPKGARRRRVRERGRRRRRTPTPTPGWCAWTWTTTCSRTSPPPSAWTPTRRSSMHSRTSRPTPVARGRFARPRRRLRPARARAVRPLAGLPLAAQGEAGSPSGRVLTGERAQAPRAHPGLWRIAQGPAGGAPPPTTKPKNAMGRGRLLRRPRVVHVPRGVALGCRPARRAPSCSSAAAGVWTSPGTTPPRAPASAARAAALARPARPKQPRWVGPPSGGRSARSLRRTATRHRAGPAGPEPRQRRRVRRREARGGRPRGVLVGTRTTTAITDATRRSFEEVGRLDDFGGGVRGGRSRRRRGVRRVRLGRRVGHALSPVSARERSMTGTGAAAAAAAAAVAGGGRGGFERRTRTQGGFGPDPGRPRAG